jgi:hypothetical protein
MSEQLTIAGVIFMVVSWIAILGLNIFCFSRIFKDKKEEIVEPLPQLDKNS